MKLRKHFILLVIALCAIGYFIGWESTQFGFKYISTGIKYDHRLDLAIIAFFSLFVVLLYQIWKEKFEGFFERYIGKFLLILSIFLISGTSSYIGIKNNTRPVINVENFGVVGNGQSFTDGAYTGTTTFTSATANFTSADQGKTIRINLAAGGGNDLITTIASVSNSTTVILANSTTGTQSAQAFDYGTENLANLQAAANSVPTTGGVLYFPLGYYIKRGLLTIPNPTAITGDMSARFGDYDSVVTNLNRAHSKIIEIAANLPQSITIQSMGSTWSNLDFYGNSGNTVTTGVGLNINASGVSIYNSQIGAFYIGVSQNYSAYWKADHSVIAGYQVGLLIQNLQTADAGDWEINGCQFGGYGGARGIATSCVLIKSSGGMKITNSKWNVGFHKGISVEITNTSQNTSDFQIMNNSIENFDSTGVNIICNNSAVFSNIVITGNQIAPYTAHTTGINLNGTGATFFKGISITSNVIYNQQTGDTAIKITAAQNVQLANEIYGLWSKQVYVDGTSTNVSYAAANQVALGTPDNGFGGTANFTSNGTTTFVQDKLQIGNSINSSGVVPQWQSQVSNAATISDMDLYPSTGTNVGVYLNLIPKGTGSSGALKTEINMFGTDFIASAANYSFGQIEFGGSGNPWQFQSVFTGSGAHLPIQFSASGNAGQLTIAAVPSGNGNVLVNNTTDNSTAFLQVTGTTAQMALHYDASNKTVFTTSSTGNETIAPSGGATSITGSLNVSGAQFSNVTLVSATGTYTILSTDYQVIFTGSTATVVYPTATTGRELFLLNQASGTVTLPTTTNGNGTTTTSLTTGQAALIKYDGTVWRAKIW